MINQNVFSINRYIYFMVTYIIGFIKLKILMINGPYNIDIT